MTENDLKAEFVKRASLRMGGAVIFAHQDDFKSGVPDVSVNWFLRTTWVEFKHADPDFDSQGIQELNMLRLRGASRAIYVVYETLLGGSEHTYICNPARNFAQTWKDNIIRRTPGHNHDFVIRFLVEMHRPGLVDFR